MKTIAKLMALCLLLNAFGLAQGTSAGKNSTVTAGAKNTTVGKNSAGTTTGTQGTHKKPLLTRGDCEALGGEVSDTSTCASGKVCTTKIYDPQKVKGYDEKTRCISVI